MSFKNPITLPKLQAIKAQMYIKTLTAILKNKLEEGQTVPFSIVLNHIYNGFDQSKSEKLPMLLLGIPKDGETTWKKFRESTIEGGKKQKEFMVVGDCTRSGNQLILTLNKSKGINKLPKPVEKRLNALLNKIIKGMTVTARGGVEEGGDGDTPQTEPTPRGTTGPVPTGGQDQTTKEKQPKAGKRGAPPEEVVEKYKEEKVEEAKELSDHIAKFRELFNGKLQVVVNNVKQGQTTKKDAKVVKETNQVYDKAIKVYRKTAKQVQAKFKKAYDELQSGKKTLYELALATKGTRKSLAQIVADQFFQETENRAATEQEIAKIQNFVKDAIQINRNGNYKAPEATVIRAVSYVLRQVGINRYQNQFLEQVLDKRQAA